jgi:hypothetical protein
MVVVIWNEMNTILSYNELFRILVEKRGVYGSLTGLKAVFCRYSIMVSISLNQRLSRRVFLIQKV